MKWEDKTETFTEEQRHYRNTYLEICEVYDNAIEVSLFSAIDQPYAYLRESEQSGFLAF